MITCPVGGGQVEYEKLGEAGDWLESQFFSWGKGGERGVRYMGVVTCESGESTEENSRFSFFRNFTFYGQFWS